MKLEQLFEHSDMYQILGHDLSTDPSFNQPKKGTISNNQDNLTRLFGESPIVDQPEWTVEFTFRDKTSEHLPVDPKTSTDPKTDKTTVKITLTGQLPEDTTITTDWDVACKNMVGLWVLEQFIEHNK